MAPNSAGVLCSTKRWRACITSSSFMKVKVNFVQEQSFYFFSPSLTLSLSLTAHTSLVSLNPDSHPSPEALATSSALAALCLEKH